MTTLKKMVSVKPTDLRMNDAYIFYYNNLAKLIITGIVPFAALCVFNTKVCYYSVKFFQLSFHEKFLLVGFEHLFLGQDKLNNLSFLL